MKKLSDRQEKLMNFLKNNKGCYISDTGYWNHNTIRDEKHIPIPYKTLKEHNLRGCGECRSTIQSLEKKGLLKLEIIKEKIGYKSRLYNYVLAEKENQIENNNK